MELSDIRNSDIVILRHGLEAIIINNNVFLDLKTRKAFTRNYIGSYLENMKSYYDKSWDIIEVKRLKGDHYETIWKEIDWSKVKVDTLIYVRDYEDEKWRPRYFSRYFNNHVYTWANGATSLTAEGNDLYWNCAKLKEDE